MRRPTWLLLGVLLSPINLPQAVAQDVTAQAAPAAPTPPEAPAPPTAPAPPVSVEDAREHFKRGEAAYQKGNYDLAITEWTAAYAADPRPRIQYNIYQARERLGQLPEAADALQKYLSTADPDDPYYADATARMASLQQRLQATGIRLVGGIEGASINISGHDWGRLPRPDPIHVQPGNHRIVVSLEGYEDFVSNVIVPAGQTISVPIQLERSTNAPASGATSGGTSAHVESSGSSDATPFFIASAGLGAGAVLSAIWAINRNSELDGCDDPKFFCPNESAVKTQRTIAIGLTVALGAGAIGTLIYGLIVNGKSDQEKALACVPGLTGASCRLRF